MNNVQILEVLKAQIKVIESMKKQLHLKDSEYIASIKIHLEAANTHIDVAAERLSWAIEERL